MKQKRMNVEDEQWSRPFQVDVYRNARSQIYNSLVSLPDTPSVTSKDPMSPGAIYEFERLEFIDGSKVDHPEGGSKDTADCIARVVQHCTEAGKSAFSFATAFGHAKLYDTSGPFVRADQKTIDPNRPADAINPKQRELEEANRAERPFGELDPTQGTINHKKRWATVKGHS